MDIMQDNSFLTKAEGDDSELVWVRFNNGVQKPMRHARKRCLDEASKWIKSLHHLPSREEWCENPQMFAIETVEELFGTFDEMLKVLERRKQPSSPRLKPIKTSRITQAPPVDTRKEKRTEMVKPVYTEQQVAKILHDACGDKAYITQPEYNAWRELQEEDAPSFITITKYLSNGQWNPQMFDRMRQLLGIKKEDEPESAPETKPEPELELEFEPEPEAAIGPVPATTPSSELTIPCCRLVSTLNREFELGDICFKVDKDDGFAVVIGTSYYNGIDKKQLNETGESQVDCYKTIYNLKMTSGKDPEHLVDFPEFAPDTLYLIDGGLYEMLPPKQRRPDLIPVWYSRNSQQKLGLYVE